MLQGVIPDIISTEPAKVIAAKEEVARLCQDWQSGDLEELDWARIKELQLRSILDNRKQAAHETSERKCLACPNFLKHVRFHI
jgi:antiviral helicase SKI2